MGKKGRRKKAVNSNGYYSTDSSSVNKGQPIKLNVNVIRLLLGFCPVAVEADSTEPSGLGEIDLVDEKFSLVRFWKTIDHDLKQRILSIDVDDAMHVLEKLRKSIQMRVNRPTEEKVQSMQAKFLYAMEMAAQSDEQDTDGEGVWLRLNEPGLEELAIILELKESLALAYAQSSIHKNVALMLIYGVWIYSYSWVQGFFQVMLAVFCLAVDLRVFKICRNAVCNFINAMFSPGKDSDSSYVEWKADSFITGTLLVVLSSGSSFYIFALFLVALPYVFSAVEGAKSIGYADFTSLGRLRKWLTWANKLVLVGLALQSWSTIALVAALFFKDTSMGILGLLISLSAFTSYRVFTFIIDRCLPQKKEDILNWITENSLRISIGIGAGYLWCVYMTWEWSPVWGNGVRLALGICCLTLLPFKYLKMLIESASFVVTLPLTLLHSISSFVLVKLGMEQPEPQSTDGNEKEKSAPFEELRRKRAEEASG